MLPRLPMHSLRGPTRIILALTLAAGACNLLPVSLGTPEPIQAQERLPEPPKPAPVPMGAPAEQAVALTEAVGLDSPDRLAGWLAVYDAFGIPVVDGGGSSLGNTGDDPIGPPFWRVWYMSGTSGAGVGFSLTDFVWIFAEPGDDSFDSQRFAAQLLEDLRAAIASDDPRVQLFGLFVQEAVERRPGGGRLSDPEAVADQLLISGDMAEFLSWVVIRGLVLAAAESAPTSFAARARLAPAQARHPAQQTPCSEMWGDEDVTRWANWVIGKIGGGIEIPLIGELTPGVVSMVQEYLGVSESVRDRTGRIAQKLNTAATLLSLAMLFSSLEASTDMGPDPLVRTRSSTAHGNEAKVFFRLTMNPGALPDGNNLIACVSSFLLNTLGVSLSFPADGAVAGAEVVFSGGQGFGREALAECGGEAYVQFTDYRQLRQDTDRDGLASIDVQGCRQKRILPDSVLPYIREFSIHASGQPEAVTADTLGNVFFGGFTFGAAPSARALISAIVDILKTFHWDLGEHTYRLRDWVLLALRIDYSFTQQSALPAGGTSLITESARAEVPLESAAGSALSGRGTILVSRTEELAAQVSCSGSAEDEVSVTLSGEVESAGTLRINVAFYTEMIRDHGTRCTPVGGLPPQVLTRADGVLSRLEGQHLLVLPAQAGASDAYVGADGYVIEFTLVEP